MSIFKSTSECKHQGIFKKAQVDEDYDFMAEDMYDPQDRDWEEEKSFERNEGRPLNNKLYSKLSKHDLINYILNLFDGYVKEGVDYEIEHDRYELGLGDDLKTYFYTDLRFNNRNTFSKFVDSLQNGLESSGEYINLKPYISDIGYSEMMIRFDKWIK